MAVASLDTVSSRENAQLSLSLMTFKIQTDNNKSPANTNTKIDVENEKVLCPHCKRTATNGIKCKGICVADSDY